MNRLLTLLKPCDQLGLGAAKPPTKGHIRRFSVGSLNSTDEQYETRCSILIVNL